MISWQLAIVLCVLSAGIAGYSQWYYGAYCILEKWRRSVEHPEIPIRDILDGK